jgi:hypothetical protein
MRDWVSLRESACPARHNGTSLRFHDAGGRHFLGEEQHSGLAPIDSKCVAGTRTHARAFARDRDEQVAKAQRAVDGHAPVKRNRYIQLSGATKSVNRTLEAKTRALAGWKGYTTNLTTQSSAFVIDAYHQLWRIEKASRMSKHDLQARPIYHRTRDSIEAHLTVVFAAPIRTVGAPVSKVMTASAQHQPASSRAMAALATTARFLR